MKLKNELEYVINQMKKLDNEKVKIYIEEIRKSNDYKNFQIRIANDLLKACVPIKTLCSWYEIYNCNDKHIDTLAIKACKHFNYL